MDEHGVCDFYTEDYDDYLREVELHNGTRIARDRYKIALEKAHEQLNLGYLSQALDTIRNALT